MRIPLLIILLILVCSTSSATQIRLAKYICAPEIYLFEVSSVTLQDVYHGMAKENELSKYGFVGEGKTVICKIGENEYKLKKAPAGYYIEQNGKRLIERIILGDTRMSRKTLNVKITGGPTNEYLEVIQSYDAKEYGVYKLYDWSFRSSWEQFPIQANELK